MDNIESIMSNICLFDNCFTFMIMSKQPVILSAWEKARGKLPVLSTRFETLLIMLA